ncbi:MAG: hypothetical protein JNL67_22255 [Planctomycetaceae bacterium]|nr:hypothetical protein [Planctomycetaceae bacterium]
MLDRRTSVLWLMPTDFERRRFLSIWNDEIPEHSPPDIYLCGFGPVASGIVTAQWLAERRPVEVVLCGIGGTFDPVLAPVGTAVEIGHVATDTVGAQSRGAPFPELGKWELPSEMGFPQIPSGLSLPAGPFESKVDQELVLRQGSLGLLTVGIASGSRATALERRKRFPGVLVEDMEGFSVALACRLAGVRCSIYRGLTNEVGDRNVANWQVDQSLRSLVQLVFRAAVASQTEPRPEGKIQ